LKNKIPIWIIGQCWTLNIVIATKFKIYSKFIIKNIQICYGLQCIVIPVWKINISIWVFNTPKFNVKNNGVTIVQCLHVCGITESSNRIGLVVFDNYTFRIGLLCVHKKYIYDKCTKK